MVRKYLVPLAAIALLSGCVSDYAYRGGSGDYYYARPTVSVYGAPYSSIGYGIGYGYGYSGGWYGHVGYYTRPYLYSPWYGSARWGAYPYGYYGHSSFYPGFYRPYRPYRPHGSHQPYRPPHGSRDDHDRGPVGHTVGPPRPYPRPEGRNLTPEYVLERLRPGASRQRGTMPVPVGRMQAGEAPRAIPRARAEARGTAPVQGGRPATVQRAPMSVPVRSAPAPRPIREPAPVRRPEPARGVREID